ncbi:hypothetical protein HNQ50_004473 [Silvimonas terrae]|uniref:Uncharacterized protein n=1 Tax=Silvimonas terrae TaxID=300266 RepID=A0A840RMK0_9NEIS|nr:hypothetical protein [Silvimonas terrae]
MSSMKNASTQGNVEHKSAVNTKHSQTKVFDEVIHQE